MSPLPGQPEVSTVQAPDGTLLSVSRRHGGDGTPLLICNGIGAGFSLWNGVLAEVTRRRPALTWDYRGLNSSGTSATDDFGPAVQAADAVAVLDTLGLDEVVVAGWSSGTRIALELAAVQPDRVRALVLVCGTDGHDVTRLVTNLEIASALPLAARFLRFFHGSLGEPFRSVMSRPEAPGIARQSGLIQATADTGALIDLFRTMTHNDLRVQLATFEAVAGSSDPRLLTRVPAPTLLVGGERDPFVTRSLLHRAQSLLPDARLEIYERAGHYLPLEHAPRLAADIDGFLKP